MRTKIHINFFIRNYFSYYFLYLLSVWYSLFFVLYNFLYIRNLMLVFLRIFASLEIEKYKSYDKGENNKSVI